MKKLALVVIATAFLAIGHAPVSAQAPPPTVKPIPPELVVECGEAEEITPDCQEFYIDSEPPVPTTVPGSTTTTIATSPPPPGRIPTTGSGVSPILGMGAVLLVGGGVVVVASRRRSSAAAR